MKKILMIVLLFSSCRNYQDRPDPVVVQSEEAEKITQANRNLVKEEAAQIDEFNLRHHFTMQMTGTGLRYQIYRKGAGTVNPVLHDQVEVSYRLFFLDGTKAYQQDTAHPLSFRLGEGNETRGLEEGLMLMKEGEKARFVVPMHLAYGLTGDQDKKIPPATTLFYDVTLLKIKK